MAYSDVILIDGKKYKVADQGSDSFQRVWERQVVDEIGLTGKTIIQDFTVSNREPHTWIFTLRVFTNSPWPDSTFGVWSDLLASARKPIVTYLEHDGVTAHNVHLRWPLTPKPRVGAAISGACHAIDFVQITMIEVYQ